MTLEELMARILSIIPDADFGKDNNGQIIIYTNKSLEDGKLVPFKA